MNKEPNTPTTDAASSSYGKIKQASKQDNDKASHKQSPKTDPAQLKIKALEDSIATLTTQLEEAKKHANDEKLRAMAEIQNIQSRYQRQAQTDKTYAISQFVKSLLELGDALEQGMIASPTDEQKQGLEMIWKVFVSTMQKNQVEVLSPLHQPYDPHLHEAMVMQPSDEYEPNTILQVIQTGYQLKDRLLRPARVIVSAKKTQENT